MQSNFAFTEWGWLSNLLYGSVCVQFHN